MDEEMLLPEGDWIREPELASRIARWQKCVAGGTLSQVPLDHPRPQQQTFTAGAIALAIESPTADGLRQVAQAVDGTLFHALAAAYAWWLHLYVNSTDVVFSAGQDPCDGSDLALHGHGASSMILQCDVSGTGTFIALVRRVCHSVAEALEDSVPVEDLVDGLGLPRLPRHSPLFATALILQPGLASTADGWSLRRESDGDAGANSAKCDISINLAEQPEGHITGSFVFRTELFDEGTALDMAAHWCALLDAVAAAPTIPMVDHDLLSPAERQRQLSWNPITAFDDSSLCVHEIISAQVERTPDAVAVQVGDATLTYRQLDDRAISIASRLVQVGAGPGTVVAMLVDRTPDLAAAMIGILKSGAAFLPLDPRRPPARNIFCINEAAPNIIVTDRELPFGEDEVTALVINLDELGLPVQRQNACSNTVAADDLAYVIYTSGSTGRPKGVLIEHRSITNIMRTMFPAMGVAGSDTVLSVASVSFDPALADIFCALACGARVVLATAEQALDPVALSQLITCSGATYLMATPTAWAALVATGWSGAPRLTAASIGETLNDALAAALLQRCGQVWNTYGPTETTVISNVARLTQTGTITVGKPLPNVRVYVADPHGRLQPVGVPGEIVIGGIGVARGYLHRPEEHARRFGDDPFHTGDRIFRTGDRARFLSDGRIQHMGRYDDQLKIRGFRIEPGEIESVLHEHPDVECCAVVACPAPHGGQQLVAYLVGGRGRSSDAQVRAWLRRRLPEYMVPRRFVYLPALPTTTSGKLDKAALPLPSVSVSHDLGAEPPGNELQRRIATLWADLLAEPVADVTCDFFDVGGDSLLAVRLIAEIQRTLGVRLSLATFANSSRTIAGLAELLDNAHQDRTDDVTSDMPLHFIFAGPTSAMSVRHFTKQWGAAPPVHVLIPEQPNGQFDRSVTVEQHANQALSAIRVRQPRGPLVLAGYSIGGVVAYEIARQAVDSGQQVEWLGVIDAVAPPMAPLQGPQPVRRRLRRLHRQPVRERWVRGVDATLRALGRGDPFDDPGAIAVACRYQQSGHDVPMQLFVSAATATDVESDLLGWNEFHHGSVKGHQLAGNHVGLLEKPRVEQLAQMMLESLREVPHLKMNAK